MSVISIEIIIKKRRKIYFMRFLVALSGSVEMTNHYNVPLLACSASIDSNKALKLPFPKDCAPFL